MSAIGRLQAALAAATNEVIVTAANLNFDFTLIKCEAPQEYQPLGNMLAATRKSDAESGSIHVTARRLGALFEGACPDAPNLLKAYGIRISEISTVTSQSKAPEKSESIFSPYAGIDGTSIWAAATSSKSALHVHLLGCMIARVFDASEAVSILVELVKERQREIATRLENNEQVPFSLAAAAAQISIPRPQLGEWDASTRAWLRTADEVKKSEYSQFRALLKNVKISVNEETRVFPSVMEAWKSAVVTMEHLISGQPQAVRDGSILLALSSWHLYPNFAVFGRHNFEVVMNDSLVGPGGTLSIGISPSKFTGEAGVFWCLSLAQLRHYGKPVRTERSLDADLSRISFPQFLTCALGAVTAIWGVQSKDIFSTMKFLATIARILEKYPKVKWLSIIGQAASSYLSAEGEELEMAKKFIQYGRRRARDFIPLLPESKRPTKQTPYFGLDQSGTLVSCLKDHETRIAFLRSKMSSIAKDDRYTPSDFLIRFVPDHAQMQIVNHRLSKSSGEEEDKAALHDASTLNERQLQDRLEDAIDNDTEDDTDDEKEKKFTCYTTVKQGSGLGPQLASPFALQNGDDACHHRWVSYSMIGDLLADGEAHHLSGHFADEFFRFKVKVDSSGSAELFTSICGDLRTAALFKKDSVESEPPKFSLEDFFVCAEAGLFSERKIIERMSGVDEIARECFVALAKAASVYKHIPEATVAIENLQRPILDAIWYRFSLSDTLHTKQKRIRRRELALAVVAYFDSGTANLVPDGLGDVMAVSSGDSIYVPSQLLSDPSERCKPRKLKRILGNFGKPGVVLLVPPLEPMMRELDKRNIMSLSTAEFDGQKIDSFDRTSLHLSFTDHHVSIYEAKAKLNIQSQASVLESVVSVHDSGQWVADVDILRAINSDLVVRISPPNPCNHSKGIDAEQKALSVENWDDIIDCPTDRFVVRAHGNWLGRLAATSVLAQVLESRHKLSPIDGKIVICQPDTCWRCLWDEHMVEEPLLQGFIY